MKMPHARGGLADGLVNGHIIVTGGDPVTDTRITLASMNPPRHGMGAAAIEAKLYVPGFATAQGASGPNDLLEAFTP